MGPDGSRPRTVRSVGSFRDVSGAAPRCRSWPPVGAEPIPTRTYVRWAYATWLFRWDADGAARATDRDAQGATSS